MRAKFENIARNTEEEVKKKAEEERKKRLLFEQLEREEQTKLYEVSSFIKCFSHFNIYLLLFTLAEWVQLG